MTNAARTPIAVCILLSGILAVAWANGSFAQCDVATPTFQARFERGVMVTLCDPTGTPVFKRDHPVRGACIHRLEGDHCAGTSHVIRAWSADARAEEECAGFEGLDGGRITCAYALGQTGGDLLITQNAQSPQKGVWGVEWSIEGIPLDMNILVPGNSGLKLTRATPGSSQTFDYPMTWEAQLVVIEGEGKGFYIRAEDTKGVFKRLTVDRKEDGWRLGFITMPYAPFEERAACESVTWRVNVYDGDWRVPARRYRTWAEKALKPIPIDEKPAWARDIRCCVIMGLDHEVLEALAVRIDPRQTLLYLPDWRTAGYDRDYPTYDRPYDTLAPFIEHAHALGFHVMLHVNYFGCDPLNPLYTQFEPYQVRGPWGSHEKEWWLWTRADPIIKFAYINPACKAWRDVLVSRFSALCGAYKVDALHLDQTLCIYNDYNGLIDGMSMIDGSVALHRELREAMPNVALSGEGLDEVTYRYEAFAQRHAMGLNHAEGTYDVATLKMAHPISSYLLRPYTILYGYLGYAPPSSGQLYCAWNEAYRYWGVIPTLKPDLAEIERPAGFSRQFFDEAAFWLRERVDIDPESAWPADVAFPFKTADGARVTRMVDGRLIGGDREISRTITGVSEMRLPGSIPGWWVYDEDRVMGLDPGIWYPWSAEPRDMKAFHVKSAFPDGFTVEAVAVHENLALVRMKPASTRDIQLAGLVGDAVTGSRPFNGPAVEVHGELHASDGALFYGSGDVIYAHPPYRGVAGSGIAYARLAISLPGNAMRFVSGVAMDPAAVGEGRSDGVTYGVTVRKDGHEAHAEVHQAGSEQTPLVLDLKPFAGQSVTLEMSVDPGPAHDPTYDWARWYGPHIEREASCEADVTIIDMKPWALALSGTNAATSAGSGINVHARFPGAVYLLRTPPETIQLPFKIASAQYETTFVSDTGFVLDAPMHAAAMPGEGTVNGENRTGLFVHPPDHGRTCVDLPVALPGEPAVFHASVGIRDGSKSSGVLFIVEMNGVRLFGEKFLPGAWHEVSCDLSSWKGGPAVLSLVTDSAGDYICDWALWADPEIRTVPN